MADGAREITADELASHRSDGDCWIAFHGSVYDVTKFVPYHPGGREVMMEVAGADGTEAFKSFHPPSMLERVASKKVGSITAAEAAKAVPVAAATSSTGPAVDCLACFRGLLRPPLREAPAKAAEAQEQAPRFPTLDHVFNVMDFELAAGERMKKSGYNYYMSAACDEITKRANSEAFSQLYLRPRVMQDVSSVDTTCTLLGCPSSLPLFISPSAMAGMAHADAEVGLAKAAGRAGIIQCIANMASRDFDEIVQAKLPGQHQWFQVYVNPDRQKTEAMLGRVAAAGITALLVTVDTNVIGRRERDQREKLKDKAGVALVQQKEEATSGGVIGALGAFTDAKLCWDDLAWLRRVTAGKMKLVLKGIQTSEDAVLAAQHGVDGIVISNHGGRQLDHARPTLDVLAEVMPELEARGLRGSMEVFLDGGIRRGTDIYKALALGAKAVGIGRPALFALSFGEAGVDKCLRIFREEFVNTMQLMGKTSLSQIGPADIAWKGGMAR